MTTDTPNRDSLRGYPCGFGDEWEGQDHCSEECPVVEMKRPCPLLPVFRAHIKLRDDMRELRAAVLGDMTAEEAAELYRAAGCAIDHDGYTPEGFHLYTLADVVAELGLDIARPMVYDGYSDHVARKLNTGILPRRVHRGRSW